MADHVRRVAAVLSTGGVALVPAEGVYGLVADSRRPDAIARLLRLKGRDAGKPMLGLIGLWRDAERWVEEIPMWATHLEHGRSAVTLLLRATPLAPEALVGPEGLIGLRVPTDDFSRRLVSDLGAPVVSTSANQTGDPAATRISEVPGSLRQRLDVVINGGPLAGQPSSIVRWENGRGEVVREGAVDRDALARLMAG